MTLRKRKIDFIINLVFLAISLLAFAYFLRVLGWLDEQFSGWCCGCMVWISEAKDLHESPYSLTLVPFSIIYFIFALFSSVWFAWGLKNKLIIAKINIPIVISNLISAIILCLSYIGLLPSEFPINLFPKIFLAIIVFIVLLLVSIFAPAKEKNNAKKTI